MMSAKKTTTFADTFAAIADADECISADDLRDLVESETGKSLNSKTVRAKLRAMQARDQKTLKNARWRIDETLAETFVESYRTKAS